MKFLIAFFGLILFVSTPPITQAADDGSLSLITAPSPISLSTKPGESAKVDITVRNVGEATEDLKVGLLKFSAYGDSGSPKLEDRGKGDDYFDWVSFSKPTFSLKPKEATIITVTIATPSTAAFGYYLAVTFGRTDATEAETIGLHGATASLILLEVDNPNAKKSLLLNSFTVDQPWYEFLPVTFRTVIANNGNVHVAPRGNIIITRDKESGSVVEVNESLGNILPNSSREFQTNWTDGFPLWEDRSVDGQVVSKNGKIEQELSWHLNKADKLRFGHYTAHLVLVYDNGSRDVPIEATVSFWVIPWRLILAVIVILTVPPLLVYLFMRWQHRRRATK